MAALERDLWDQFVLHAFDGARDLREAVGVHVVCANQFDQFIGCHTGESIAENTRLAILNLRANMNFNFTNITHEVRNSC